MTLTIVDLGLMKYQKAWDIQKKIHEDVINKQSGPIAIFVEHPPVLTLGKNSDRSYVYISDDELEKNKIDIVNIDRGGEVTAHVPGQLVVYPIVYLPTLKIGAKSFITALESTIIDSLKEFGINAGRHLEHPGVWVEDSKIAAVGVRIKNRGTLHGFALNISNSFDLFQKILPCGIRGLGVTSMEELVGKKIVMNDVKKIIHKSLAKNLLFGNYTSITYEDFKSDKLYGSN